MLPSVVLAESVEMLREGGSLCASFQGSNGSHYWLVLPIRIGAYASGEARGYETPVVVERPYAPQEIPLSWEGAEILLRQIEQLLPCDANRTWVQPMYDCIAKRGYWHAWA